MSSLTCPSHPIPSSSYQRVVTFIFCIHFNPFLNLHSHCGSLAQNLQQIPKTRFPKGELQPSTASEACLLGSFSHPSPFLQLLQTTLRSLRCSHSDTGPLLILFLLHRMLLVLIPCKLCNTWASLVAQLVKNLPAM